MKENIWRQYVAGGLVIGVLQILDGLLHAFGALEALRVNYALIELIWFLFSFIVLMTHRANRVRVRAPLIFCFYLLASASLAMVLDTSKNPESAFVLPAWYGLVSVVVGWIYLKQCWLQVRTINSPR